MARNKRNPDWENADEKKEKKTKSRGRKRLRTGAATLTICAAAFGAYYSPHFRAASSDWLERWRDNGAKEGTRDDLSEETETGAPAETSTESALAQAPSFRDFLTDEYGEEGARELLGIAEPSSGATQPSSNLGFADYVAAENAGDFESDVASEGVDSAGLATASAQVAPPVLSEDETALAARLEAEMKERGVGNPRIERWGGRFWRASGFATTDDGVAAFCEAVDVDPTAAQRAALAKFDAAKF